MWYYFSDSDNDEIHNPKINVQNKELKVLSSGVKKEDSPQNVLEDDGLSSQNESDESQDRFSYKEFDSDGKFIS